ncbi:hypothetical protein HHK36_024340 [Tetracentron sinense]|uniref:Phytocyanin domain-containing protein n=1 Tax=Tetracentron sinense TaxID=13715 RepID=A0A835D4J6_TETSI|nr:hypothetical protein HHK36_024340 [Tetracentron sinense]
MASLFMGSCRFVLILTLFSTLQLLFVDSVEFEVGDDKGWVLPSSKNNEIYNQWASKKRFQINDTVRFKYKKDSVLVVTDAEYEKCHSSYPIFFSNNGDTIFKLDRPGLFYFISGVTGHCERGQHMIIKVLEPESPPSPGNQNSTSGTSGQSGAVGMAAIPSTIIMQFIFSFLGFLFI